MKWTRPSAELVAKFEAVVPGPPVTKRKMFGFPAAFVNGNMFMSLFQENMILRLSEALREEIRRKEGAAPFEPMPGHPMKEYVRVPTGVLNDPAELNHWVAKSLAYGSSLKPKSKSKSSAPKSKRKKK